MVGIIGNSQACFYLEGVVPKRRPGSSPGFGTIYFKRRNVDVTPFLFFGLEYKLDTGSYLNINITDVPIFPISLQYDLLDHVQYRS